MKAKTYLFYSQVENATAWFQMAPVIASTIVPEVSLEFASELVLILHFKLTSQAPEFAGALIVSEQNDSKGQAISQPWQRYLNLHVHHSRSLLTEN